MRTLMAGIALLLLAAADAVWLFWSWADESESTVYLKFGNALYALMFILTAGAFVCFWVAAFRAARRRVAPEQ